MKANTFSMHLGLLIFLGCVVAMAAMITSIDSLVIYTVLLGAIIIIFFLFKDITNVVIIWLLSLLFVEFSKFSLGIDLPNLSLDRILWLLLIFYCFFHIITGRICLSNRFTEILMLLLSGLALFSIIRMPVIENSNELRKTYSLYFNTYIVPFSMFLIAKDFIYGRRQLRKFFVFLSVVLLYLSLTAIFENFRVESFVFPKDILNPKLGINFGRARGPFLSASVNGTVMGMLSITNLHMAINTRFPYKLFFVIVALLSPLAIFFTYTRASWLAMIAAFLLIILIGHRFRKYFVILALLSSVLISLFSSRLIDVEKIVSRSYAIGPVYDRINLYHTYLAMFMDRPLLGFGFCNFDNYCHEYFSSIRIDNPYVVTIPTTHDTFASILVELGMLGMIIFLSILTSILWKSCRLFKGLKENDFLSKGIVVTFWGVASVYLINAIFIDMKFHQFQNVIFYILAGSVLGLSKRRNEVSGAGDDK